MPGRYLAELKRRSGDDGEISRPKRARHVPSQETDGLLPRAPTDCSDEPGRLEEVSRDTLNGNKSTQSVPPIVNPLASGLAEFVTDNNGRKCFLGPSSTWAYSQQVMQMIKRHLPDGETRKVPFNPDGSAFVIESPAIKPTGPLTMQQLPSLDFGLYLVNAVKFRLGQLYHVFDEQTFMPKLYDFYSNGGPSREPLLEDRLWYVQYLTITGIGHALLFEFIEEKPAGFVLIARALELLPDILRLYQDPLLSIEILCGLALYLQCMDHRNSAYAHIGLALRLALSKGLHREMASVDMNHAETRRRQAIWWTVYILDRKFSSLMGAPTSIHDEDVTVPLPGPVNSHAVKGLSVHVAVSRLLAQVVNSIYGVDGKVGPSFLRNMQGVLRSMAALVPELERAFEIKLDSSRPISRVAATLNLYYHQCIVLATRPLLMCLLRNFLEQRNSEKVSRKEVTEPIKALLKASRDSATKSLAILAVLQSQQLLDVFVPFDLESTFSCAFVLSLMSTLPSIPAQDIFYVDKSFAILNYMIQRGNRVAEYRKGELENLFGFLEALRNSTDQVNHAESSDNTAESMQTPGISIARTNDALMHPPESNMGALESTLGPLNGLSPDTMLLIAGLLDWEPTDDLFQYPLSTEWLWAEPQVLHYTADAATKTTEGASGNS
ncbi:hypothetical protein PFICI_02576 [Pestalotiopsis fici W106-1]|uniref:Xylanolytic transcriptional activator regulatory domain-containing protein n=1 Tax=Pestalotiopsis fici (strain W106-1 / CGMCC3.15140) TaxID=1229662 RepID=W3XH44_PESFW|nr:uncharacterized protein PFICI_02576 [Pestalotiopsis fici W106-1]ETS84551.1 hypothetical protein PFICI_02576 [Pestalotiopsis fici W106-1]